jgi:hypothetical protein
MAKLGRGRLRPGRFVALGALALLGCGSDPTTGEINGAGGANEGAGAQDADKDAGAQPEGDAGRQAAVVADAGGDAQVFRCGEVACPVSGIFAACCTDEGAGVPGNALELTGRASNLCGADLGPFVDGVDYVCIQLNQPGKLDEECPEVASPGGMLACCCTDEGFCGGMETMFPLGCSYGLEGRGEECGK